MNLTNLIILALAQQCLAHIIERAACNADNCARAVTGTAARPSLATRQSDCSRFMTTIITPAAVTLTVTQTVSAVVRRSVFERKGVSIAARQAQATPTYATACSGTSRYSSACSCWGYTASLTTIATPTIVVTSTITTTPTATTSTTTSSTTTSSVLVDDVAGYGCDADYISRSGYGWEICPAAYDLKCGQSASSDADAKIINPPASQPNLANGYQYCDFECKRRRTCFGFSYTYIGLTCTLFVNSDGSRGSYVLSPDRSAVSAELLPDCAPYACPETTCPLEA